MNVDETGKVLAVIKKNYPHAYKDFTAQEKADLLVLWQEMFADDDYMVVGAAVKTFIANDTKGFAPIIGQIKELIRKLTEPEQMSEQEAANRIIQASQNSIYHAQEEFDKLPPILQRLAGSPARLREWAMMDYETVNSVVASNLMRSYKAISQKQETMQALPSSVKALLEGVSERMTLKGSTDNGTEV